MRLLCAWCWQVQTVAVSPNVCAVTARPQTACARQPAENPAGWVPKPRPAEGATQNGLMPNLAPKREAPLTDRVDC